MGSPVQLVDGFCAVFAGQHEGGRLGGSVGRGRTPPLSVGSEKPQPRVAARAQIRMRHILLCFEMNTLPTLARRVQGAGKAGRKLCPPYVSNGATRESFPHGPNWGAPHRHDTVPNELVDDAREAASVSTVTYANSQKGQCFHMETNEVECSV